MRNRRLGETGISVSEIALGTAVVDREGFASDATALSELRDAISAALDLGVTLIDTADLYGRGNAELLLGELLRGEPTVAIATKVGQDFYAGREPQPNYHRRKASRGSPHANKASAKTRRGDGIDVCQLHNPVSQEAAEEGMSIIAGTSLEQGRSAVRALSVSSPNDGRPFVGCDAVSVVQLPMNLFFPSAAATALSDPHCARIGILAREPLLNGILAKPGVSRATIRRGDARLRWTPHEFQILQYAAQKLQFLAAGGERTLAQAAIRFVLDQPFVSSVIVGCRTPQQLRENVGAADLPPITDAERRRVLDALLSAAAAATGMSA